MMRRLPCFLLPALLALSLAGCAVQYVPAELAPSATVAQGRASVLTQALELQLATGYRRTLAGGSRWTHAGRIAQGDVYRPYQSVFTLEGSHVHEAYLVVEGGRLVGFYLPAEKGFSPLQPTLPFSLQ